MIERRENLADRFVLRAESAAAISAGVAILRFVTSRDTTFAMGTTSMRIGVASRKFVVR